VFDGFQEVGVVEGVGVSAFIVYSFGRGVLFKSIKLHNFNIKTHHVLYTPGIL